MKKILTFLFSIFLSIQLHSQSCTSTVYFDNIESFTWLGDWWSYSFSNFFTNHSVSPTYSAVHFGNGTSTSGREEDWYVMPRINDLNPNNTYKVRFKLASYTVTAPTAATRGVDAADYVQVQVSINGGSYVSEMTIYGFSNQTWPYTATGIASKTMNGSNTSYQITSGGLRNDGYSTVELTLPPNTTSVAVDLYMRCNSSGEEFWIDDVELIETINAPIPVVFGDTVVPRGQSTTLTAVGGNTFVWSSGITNNVAFTPLTTSTYSVTSTYNGMINGVGSYNTCTAERSINVIVYDDAVLPILLSSFVGEKQNNAALLNWTTELELNSSHVEVQRSVDGINFLPLGQVPTNNSSPYSFIDSFPINGYNYYRLKLVDLDQTFTYSNTIAIEFSYITNEYTIYPNPFTNSINYLYYSENPEDLEVCILDAKGQHIRTHIITCPACYNRVNIDLEDLLPGRYMLVIKHKQSLIVRSIPISK